MTERLEYRELAGAAYKQFLNAHSYLKHCGLPLDLLELVYLRCSLINGCAHCIDMHSQELLKTGCRPEKLVLVSAWREAEEVFSDRERAALAWAETVTRVADTQVPDEEYKAASLHFNEKELVDLTMAIALINAFNRLAVSFRSPVASFAAQKA